jgi:hypothetical protein
MKDEALSAAQSSAPLQVMQKQQGKAPVSTALLLAIESRDWARAQKLIASGAPDVNTRSARVSYRSPSLTDGGGCTRPAGIVSVHAFSDHP